MTKLDTLSKSFFRIDILCEILEPKGLGNRLRLKNTPVLGVGRSNLVKSYLKKKTLNVVCCYLQGQLVIPRCCSVVEVFPASSC